MLHKRIEGDVMQVENYRFPLQQAIGCQAIPIVTLGQQVTAGQLIAAVPKGELGSPLYSSVAGEISVINEETIEILPFSKQGNVQQLAVDEPLAMIQAAGIVGLGGAGFPTYEKLAHFEPGGTLIINAAECEPILSHNLERIKKSSPEILKGITILQQITQSKRAIIAIKEKNTAAIAALKSSGLPEKVALHYLRDLYPMGDERAIVRDTLGQLLPVTERPAAAKALVLNVETVYRVEQAVIEHQPFITKDLTLAGRLDANECVKVLLDVPLGCSLQTILATHAPHLLPYGELIMGGPFTGKAVELVAVIEKTTGGVIATLPFPKEHRKLGLLVCACGATETRMQELAEKMGTTVSGIEYCKQALPIGNGRYKCKNPGECPGQVEKVLKLRQSGAQALLIGNCSDCSNTVMAIAPKLSLPVYHTTDFALRSVGLPLIRKLK
jgi:proline reductase-associated electron transfer protein PrdC